MTGSTWNKGDDEVDDRERSFVDACELRSLTERERDVLALVAQGHPNVGISKRLGVTVRTVETHTSRIFMKLGLVDGDDMHRRVLATRAHLGAPQVARSHPGAYLRREHLLRRQECRVRRDRQPRLRGR